MSQGMRCVFLCCLLLLAVQPIGTGCTQAQPPARERQPEPAAAPRSSDRTSPLLWLVEARSGSRLYLMGSVHVGPHSGWRHPAHVERAFEASTALIVELDMRAVSADEQQALLLRYGMLGPEQSLRDRVSAATWGLLERHVASTSLQLEALERMQAWLVANVLVMNTAVRLGLSPQDGVDHDFLARAGQRRVLSLETAEQQLRSMSELPGEVQEYALRDMLGHAGEIEGYLEAMVEAWRIGDEGALIAIVFEGLYDQPQYQPFFEALIFERNRQMTEQIVQLLEQGTLRTGFLVVGIAHLVGEQSILDLLERRGYPAERVQGNRFAEAGQPAADIVGSDAALLPDRHTRLPRAGGRLAVD